MPKFKSKKTRVNRIKSKPGYKGLPKGAIEAKIISINKNSLQEIDRLENLVKDYQTLISRMETEWQPKKTASRMSLEFIASMLAILKRRL